LSRRGAILQDYGGTFPEQSHDAEKAAASYYQRDKEQDKDLAYRRQQGKEKQGADATKFITELKNEKTGINDIDVENDKQLLAAQNKMIDMMQKGAPLSEIQIYAMRELPKINNAYTVGKNYKEQVTKGMTDMEKKYGDGVDLKELQNRAYKKMADDIFDRDEKGNIIGYKDPSLIPKNRDYVSEIENDEEALGTVFKPSGGLSTNIKTFPTPSISRSEDKRGKDGRTRYNGFTGQGSVFVEEDIDPETGVTKGLKYKSEKVPLGNNPDGTTNYVEVMPEDEFGLMTQTPAAKKEFDIMFRSNMKEMGIDPSKLDSRAKDILKRGYALEWMKETNIDGSAFNPKMKDIQPLPPRVSVRVSTGGAKDVPVMDIVTPIKDYFTQVGDTQKDELKGVAQLNLFNNEVTTPVVEEVKKRYPDITADDIYYQKDGNNIWVMKTNETGKVDRKKDVPVFKLDDFSNVTGNKPQGQKSKNKALSVAQEGDANRTAKKEMIPVGTILTGKDGKKIKTTKEITKAEAEAAGYK